MKIGVIPARLNSTRFPRKILAPINGKPMIVHVFERASQAKELDKILIAVDSKETVDALKPYKIETVMTDTNLNSGTDRVYEASKTADADIIINIQGDEPLIEPKLIDSLVKTFEDNSVEMATAVFKKMSLRDIVNPNVVKAFLDENLNAYSFKREIQQGELGACYRHIGIYGFRKQTLEAFIKLPQSENEKKFRLEQLRALDNGIKIKAVISPYLPYGVDTPEDLEEVTALMENFQN